MAAEALPPAVLVGVDGTTGLQVARILDGHGVPVVGIADDASHFAARTRACRRVVEADTRSPALIEVLERLARELAGAVLIPCSDMAVLQVSRHRDRLAGYRWSLPEPETVEALVDKARFHELATGSGLPVPPGRVLRTRRDAEAAACDLRFPCALKPGVKTPAWQAQARAKAFRVEDGGDLLDLYDRVAPLAESLLVHEWVEGPDERLVSCYCLFDSASRLFGTFVVRTLRQWPSETGTCCLGEEWRDDEVLETATELFARVGLRGLGHLETKRAAGTDRLFVVEVNVGRPTARSPIAEAAGVELHWALYRDAAGLPLPPARPQPYAGRKWVYLREDALSAARAWRRGRLTLREWWRSWRGAKALAVFSATDPAPFLYDVAGTALRIVRRRFRAARRARGGEATRVRSR